MSAQSSPSSNPTGTAASNNQSQTNTNNNPSNSSSNKKKCNKIFIRNFPADEEQSVLENLCSEFGRVLAANRLNEYEFEGNKTVNYEVAFESVEIATNALEKLKEEEVKGHQLKVDYSHARQPRRGQAKPVGSPEFPLRILVPGDMVGAIIGKKGITIKQITQTSRARVDVLGRETHGLAEKAIFIYGQPECCSSACKEILNLMHLEGSEENRGGSEVCLKILAHNNLCGRLIGKSGSVIKNLMEETNTKVTVSRQELFNYNYSNCMDPNSYNIDRVITIHGSVENICAAEEKISAILRSCHENDMKNFNTYPPVQPFCAQGQVWPNVQTMSNYGPSQMRTPGMAAATGFGSAGPGTSFNFMPQTAAQGVSPSETVYLYIPNVAVGAIIGTKGNNIKSIIHSSGANIKIAPIDSKGSEEAEGGAADNNNSNGNKDVTSGNRCVTITGTPEAQWKAQYYIFDKIKTEGFCGNEDVRLTSEILAPKAMVGRIIGKGGAVVKDIQRTCGANIKLPETPHDGGDNATGETKVHITGVFYNSQMAQRKIRALITKSSDGGMAGVNNAGSAGGFGMAPPMHPHQHMGGPQHHGGNHHPQQPPRQHMMLPPQAAGGYNAPNNAGMVNPVRQGGNSGGQGGMGSMQGGGRRFDNNNQMSASQMA